MPPGTIAIVLVAAVAHAVWNTVSKGKRGDTVRFVWAYTALSAVLCLATVAVWSAVRHPPDVGYTLVLAVAVSGVLHVAYSLTLQIGYDHSPLGVVYPIARGTGPVLTTLCAVLFLGQAISRTETLGAALVIAGVVVVTGNPFRTSTRGRLRGVLWGTATGVMIAAYTLWDAHAMTNLRVDPLTYFSGTLVVETLLLAPQALRRGAAPVMESVRQNAPLIPAIAVLSPVAYVLVLFAMRSAPVAVVAPLRESSIVLGSFLAWWLFHEGLLARRLVGAAVVLAGIAAISA
ncbi:DMT family transporter [Gryllotalpicola koreensis]|uniref:DMT family transporter n=1 Tax=Gryllotalpicola koreensis TaxID=993086 RepID=A0ABP8A3L2_9MICO